ncbi:MAG: T9SS type A sorting domain-containing protein, partial [Ignavibacteria bacterium]
YSPDGTYPDADYFAVYGEPCLPKENDTTAVENEIVNGFALANYPNPFNPSTNINFSIPKAQNVKLLIYNLLGEKVKELVNSNMEAGSYTVQWNGDNQSGRKVNSGVYFSVLQTQEKRIVKKMILSK